MPGAKDVGKIVGGLGLALLMVVSARADTPEPAKWVAGDAIVYIEAISPASLLDRLHEPKVQAILASSPAYKKALDNPKLAELKGVAEVVTSQLGTTTEKAIADLLGGGAMLAVEGKKGPERVFLVVSPNEAEFLPKAHAKLVELARKDAEGKGKPDPIKEREYRGVTAYSVSPAEAHAIVDGRLSIVANGGRRRSRRWSIGSRTARRPTWPRTPPSRPAATRPATTPWPSPSHG